MASFLQRFEGRTAVVGRHGAVATAAGGDDAAGPPADAPPRRPPRGGGRGWSLPPVARARRDPTEGGEDSAKGGLKTPPTVAMGVVEGTVGSTVGVWGGSGGVGVAGGRPTVGAPPPIAVGHVAPLPRLVRTPPAPAEPTAARRGRPATDPPRARDTPSEATDDASTETSGQRKRGYRPYTLEDYRRMRAEAAALSKLGGLGPADTDEQRAERQKRERMMEYGKKAEGAIREVIGPARRGVQPSIPTQPTPVDVIERRERRQKAMDFARAVPKPQPRRAHSTNVPTNVRPRADDIAGADGVARLERERGIAALEAQHEADRRKVEALRALLHL